MFLLPSSPSVRNKVNTHERADALGIIYAFYGSFAVSNVGESS